uniref:Ig-like domain-containing protein n=1 Tax=Anabas testudineus TaxID=64144 RepID=A0A3Q1HS98_ANATE
QDLCEQVLKPVVSVYPAASRDHLEGKSSLLCVASDMFPPLVQFSWKIQKKKKEDGSWDESSPTEGEQLELRESGRSASILLLHQPQNSTYKYRCEVKHEGGTVEAQTQQGDEGLVTVFSRDSASCGDASQYQVKLLCLLYTVLIVKSLVYCCGLSLLRILTHNGASSNYSHDD